MGFSKNVFSVILKTVVSVGGGSQVTLMGIGKGKKKEVCLNKVGKPESFVYRKEKGKDIFVMGTACTVFISASHPLSKTDLLM